MQTLPVRKRGPRRPTLYAAPALLLAGCFVYDEALLNETLSNGSQGGGGALGSASGGAKLEGGAAGRGAGAGESPAVGGGAVAGTGGNATGGTSFNSAGEQAGLGGADDAGGAGGQPELRPPSLIDDFDDGDAAILPFERRSGGWYNFNDETGEQNPFAIALAAGNTTPAAHIVGQGFKTWGAGIGTNLKDASGERELYDVTRYSGIAFRAKVEAGTQSSARLLVITTRSAPQYGFCGAGAGKGCGDHLYCTITPLKTTWTTHECRFQSLVQDGFGLPQPTLDPKSVLAIQIRFGTESATIDAWLDDIAFVPAAL